MFIQRFEKMTHLPAGDIAASQKRLTHNITLHWHEFYEIEFVLSGSGTYYFDGRAYELKRGMFFLMTPANYHEIKTTGAEIINIMFLDSACISDALFYLAMKSDNLFYLSESELAFITLLSQELISASKNGNKKYSGALLDTILLKLNYKNNCASVTEFTPIQAATLYILNNFRTHISLSDVSSHVRLTPSYLSSLFKKNLGVTFKSYLNSIRFEYAKKLIINSELKITDICYESGFDDYSNFERRFKAYFGTPPKNFRTS